MSRIYATEEDSGCRFLLRIECDGNLCKASIAPNPEISKSGWRKHGVRKHDCRFEYDYCPECS